MIRQIIPYDFNLRSYQREVFLARQRGVDRLLLVWHRRAGKDKVALNLLIFEALMRRAGVYFLIAPLYSQAKLIWWRGKDNDGRPFLHRHIPEELIARTNEQEMSIEFTNGSRLQLLGSDNMDTIIGSNPIGCVFTEFAVQSSLAYDLMRPILMANRGWALFNGTPRGTNHFHRLYLQALDATEWFTSLKTVEDTSRDADGEDGTPVVTQLDIDRAVAEGMDPDLVSQEFWCSWNGYAQGSYYGSLINDMRNEGRISVVPWDRNRKVFTAWDLGVADSTAIVFAQATEEGRIDIIDYIEARGQGLTYYAKEVRAKPYSYSNHYAPHDIAVREFSTGRSRLSMASGLGIEFRVAPNLTLQDGIDSARALLPMCRVDVDRCKQLIDALAQYHRAFDEKTNSFSKAPKHDWSSHGADAFRYLSLVADEERDENRHLIVPKVCGLNSSPFDDEGQNDW